MRFNLIPPKHTGASAVRRLAAGLESGRVVPGASPEEAALRCAEDLERLAAEPSWPPASRAASSARNRDES